MPSTPAANVAAARREKRHLKGADRIGLRVGKVVGKCKMARHFDLDIEENSFGYVVGGGLGRRLPRGLVLLGAGAGGGRVVDGGAQSEAGRADGPS